MTQELSEIAVSGMSMEELVKVARDRNEAEEDIEGVIIPLITMRNAMKTVREQETTLRAIHALSKGLETFANVLLASGLNNRP
jgi:predicted nucleic-acid-binding protein